MSLSRTRRWGSLTAASGVRCTWFCAPPGFTYGRRRVPSDISHVQHIVLRLSPVRSRHVKCSTVSSVSMHYFRSEYKTRPGSGTSRIVSNHNNIIITQHSTTGFAHRRLRLPRAQSARDASTWPKVDRRSPSTARVYWRNLPTTATPPTEVRLPRLRPDGQPSRRLAGS